ncbi:MAG: DUF6766 family protein [Gemmatimonadales bacterium]
MRRILRENGLSIVLMSLFLLFWAGQSVVGHREHNSEQRQHSQPEVAYGSYLRSAHFWEATGENWESEFLQMFGYVILTALLYQKGSSESKKPGEPEPVISISLHAVAGAAVYNDEQASHEQPENLSVLQYASTSRFWFESFQNWQSEFLAMGAMVVLSIFLRQRGSPESKPVDSPHEETGSG